MSKVIITCDRQGDLCRAAVWQGHALIDLYVDRLLSPDYAGAVARGKIVRTLAGQKAAWVDAGLAEKIYVESATPLKSGDLVTVRIHTTFPQEQGKAWRGAIVKEETGDIGLISPPPTPWQRALHDIKATDQVLVRFMVHEDMEAFKAQPPDARFQAEHVKNDLVHDGLDEIIDGLLEKKIPLTGGGNLVLERTQALVAIDVNAGEAGNPAAVNLAAVREAARQIRLRNLSGIIVIDCLKTRSRTDQSQTLNAFSRVVQDDPATVLVFGISKLGLLECTRPRRGPALSTVMLKG